MKVISLLRRTIKAIKLLKSRTYRKGLWQGVAASIEHTAALSDLKVRAAIDVGANKGQFSLFIRNTFPDAKIYAFEPLDEPANQYKLLFADDHNCKLYTVALGKESKTTHIHLSGSLDSSSLLPILKRQSDLYPGTEEVGERAVRVDRGENILKDLHLPPPLLIKIDVQGYEMEVLEGFGDFLSKADYIYLEICFQELYEKQATAASIINFLNSRNFEFDSIFNLSTDPKGRPVYADALFKRNAHNMRS